MRNASLSKKRASKWGSGVSRVMRACRPLLQGPHAVAASHAAALRVVSHHPFCRNVKKIRRVHSHRGESKPQDRDHCIVPASSVARSGTELPGRLEPGRSGALPQRRSAATTRTHRCSIAEEAAHGRLRGVVDLRGHGGGGLRQAGARQCAKTGKLLRESDWVSAACRGSIKAARAHDVW